MAWESHQCPNCSNQDSIVQLDEPGSLLHVTWEDGRKFEVAQYRCLSCGAADLVKRDWSAKHEKDKSITGTAMPADGRLFITRPAEEASP